MRARSKFAARLSLLILSYVVAAIAAIAVAADRPSADVAEQIDQLNDDLLGVAPPEHPDDLRERNARYEERFAALGSLASSGNEVNITNAEKEPYPLEEGITSDGEDLPGFFVANRWSGYMDARGVTVFAGASEGEPRLGAIWVFENGEPAAAIEIASLGPVRIIAVAGSSSLILEDRAGHRVTYDADAGELR